MAKDTFTLADLANFKLEDAAPHPAAPAETQPAESSAAPAAPSDEAVELSEDNPTTSAAADAAPDGSDEPETQIENRAPPAKAKGGKTAREFIAELSDERDALRRFNEYLLARESQPAAPAAVIPAPAPVAETLPTLESSGFDVVKYEQSMKDWTAKQVEAAKAQGARTATEANARASFDSRLETFVKANPAAKAVFSSPSNLKPLDKEAQTIVVESEMGPQILYHLLANPDQAVRIARKSSAQQIADIGRIEGELRAKATKPPQKTTPNITRAPNPPTPTSGRGNTPTVDPMKLSTKEWIEWDRQQELERRRARKSARSA